MGVQPNIATENIIKVYPNPAKDYVSFEYNLPPANKSAVIEIFNTQGIKVKNFILSNTSGTKVWDTRQTIAGMYYYHIRSENNVIQRGKIVIMNY
ncbi:MAG: T9SS type A sorting domain-containing protein [Bacteroidales bacterium]|nr:T9SS type A sorting domain-containing protein [Bacteroidales bacterium]